jgi:O-succinylbenzoic acid--CoA ligase
MIPSEIRFLFSSNHAFVDASSTGRNFSYAHLWTYKEHLSHRINELDIASEQVILIQSNRTDELCLTIAALFLCEQAFCVVDTYVNENNLKQLANKHRFHRIWDEPFISNEITKSSVLRSKPSLETISISFHPKHEVFGYLFTSGSTGEASLIPLRYSQLIAATKNSGNFISLSPNQTWGIPLSFHHIGALSVLLKCMLWGSAISLSSGSDYERWNRWLSRDSTCRIISLVPTQLHHWLAHNKQNAISVDPSKNFGYVLLGGGPSNALDIQEAIQMNWPIMLSYGMTETFAHVSSGDAYELDSIQKFSVSTPLPVGRLDHSLSLDLRSDGRDSIIWLKGDQIVRPDSRTAPLHDRFDEEGWFCTGDIGELDKNGNLVIHARRSDRIVSGGENVAPKRVQDVLLKSPSVKDVHIFGKDDPVWGQKVVAVIQLHEEKGSQLTTNTKQVIQSLTDYCKKELPTSHIPKEIQIVSTIPRTTLGKIRWVEFQNILNKA